MKLFAAYLGGTAPRSNTELHDMVFAVGETIESTYHQLMTLWFGNVDGLHIDSWAELDVIDGHKIALSLNPPPQGSKLYFVNLGAYVPGELIEAHSNHFLVSDDKKSVIKRAKESCLKGMTFVHRDYLYDVDDCLEIESIGRYYVHLTSTSDETNFKPVSAYHLVPRVLVEAFKATRPQATV